MTIAVTKDTFDAEVLKSDKPVLVDFWAGWCGPCKMLAPILEELASEHSEYKVCKIDVDAEKELQAQFNIMSIPTLIVFKDGEKIEQHAGFMPKEALHNIMKKHI